MPGIEKQLEFHYRQAWHQNRSLYLQEVVVTLLAKYFHWQLVGRFSL
ncbi:MAG: hypothetical protein ACWA6U_13710 [Breznakibacter sp.]